MTHVYSLWLFSVSASAFLLSMMNERSLSLICAIYTSTHNIIISEHRSYVRITLFF